MAAEDYLTTPYVVMEVIRETDPMGGERKRYCEKMAFTGGALLKRTAQTRLAGQKGSTAVYVLMTDDAVRLERDWIICRLEDGAFFRVTVPSRERKTPSLAGLRLSMAEMERMEL